MIKKIVLLNVSVALFGSLLFCINVELVKKIKLSQEEVIIQLPVSFCVIEDEYFCVPDLKAGDIKLYDKIGKLIKVIGERGFGPGEFVKPSRCDYRKPYLALFDSGKRKLFIYIVKDKLNWELKKEITFTSIGYDLRIKGDRILISGYKIGKNKKEYDLYIYNIKNDEITYLLPSEKKYGYGSYRRYKAAYREKIAPIGIMGYCDWLGEDAVFVWEGDLEIMKIDTNSHKMSYFEEKRDNYVKPIVTEKLGKGFRARNVDLIKEELSDKSFVSDIFVGPNYVGVIYTAIDKKTKKQKTSVQFYNPDGKFVSEIDLTMRLNNKVYFHKEKGILYLLTLDYDENIEYLFEILEFKIDSR